MTAVYSYKVTGVGGCVLKVQDEATVIATERSAHALATRVENGSIMGVVFRRTAENNYDRLSWDCLYEAQIRVDDVNEAMSAFAKLEQGLADFHAKVAEIRHLVAAAEEKQEALERTLRHECAKRNA